MAFRNKKKLILIVLLLLLFIPIALMGMNKIAPVSWNLFGPVYTSDGVAIDGYDPVAYHTLGKAQKGNPAHALEWKNVIWHFISQEHKELFQAKADQYAPKFGGYCAIAVNKGLTAKVDPEAWHIENGKLFLFFNETPKIDFIAKVKDGIIQQTEDKWANAYDL